MKILNYLEPQVSKKQIQLNLFFVGNPKSVLLAGCGGGASCTGGNVCKYCCDLGCYAPSCSCPSDARLKTDVKPIANALDKLTKLKGVSFEWNSKYKNLYHSSSKRELGLMAQDVEKVFPELVGRENNNYRVVDYSKITAVLVEAVKELKEENKFLQKRLSKLEKQ